jgi:hypothetical protein
MPKASTRQCYTLRGLRYNFFLRPPGTCVLFPTHGDVLDRLDAYGSPPISRGSVLRGCVVHPREDRLLTCGTLWRVLGV